ncbi:MAG: nitroreductase family protein [Phycisphaerae bacterium]
MDFFEVITERRSVRNFTGEPVPREALEELVRAGIEAPSGVNAQLRQYIIIDEPETMDELRPISAAMKNAPAAIVVVMDPTPTKFGEYWIQDASAAMQNMHLAAVAMGYGSCWIEGPRSRCEKDLRDLLGVPENLRVWAILAVGAPAVRPRRPEKSEFINVVHYNRFSSDA